MFTGWLSWLLVPPLTKVLIHADYGEYGMFSDEFHRTFRHKYEVEFETTPQYYPHLDKQHHKVGIESRWDPRTVEVFEQLGPERSRDKTRYTEDCGRVFGLHIVEIPTALLDVMYISEYDGLEWVWCNTSQKYRDILMETLGIDDVLKYTQQRVNEMKWYEEYLDSKNILYL